MLKLVTSVSKNCLWRYFFLKWTKSYYIRNMTRIHGIRTQIFTSTLRVLFTPKSQYYLLEIILLLLVCTGISPPPSLPPWFLCPPCKQYNILLCIAPPKWGCIRAWSYLKKILLDTKDQSNSLENNHWKRTRYPTYLSFTFIFILGNGINVDFE